jgi:hypothetical protein
MKSFSTKPPLPPLSYHLHAFQSENVEFYIYTTSPNWSWDTFLYEGIFEHKAAAVIKVTNGESTNPGVFHFDAPVD